MLRYSSFNLLPLDHRADYMWRKGVFLICQLKGGYSWSLYAVDDFYVELCYSPNTNQILQVLAFKDPDWLSPYLDKITVGKLT